MPTCGSPDDPTKPDMSFAYEDKAHGGHILQGLNRLAADHPIRAIIIGVVINIALAAGVGFTGFVAKEIAERISHMINENSEVQK